MACPTRSEGEETERGRRGGEEGNLLPDVARTDALGSFVEAFARLACVSMMHPAFTPVLPLEAPRSFALLRHRYQLLVETLLAQL